MEIRHRKNTRAPNIAKYAAILTLVVAISCGLAYTLFFHETPEPATREAAAASNEVVVPPPPPPPPPVYKKKTYSGAGIRVFYPVYGYGGDSGLSSSAVEDKLIEDLQNSRVIMEAVPLDTKAPPGFLETCGGTPAVAKERFGLLKASKQPHLTLELLKYCALEHYRGGLYVDSQSTLSNTLENIVSKSSSGNLAVLNDAKISPDSIHGGLLYIAEKSSKTKQSAAVVEGMIRLLLSTEIALLESSPLFLPKSLYKLVAKDMGVQDLSKASLKQTETSGWYLLQHTCSLFSMAQRQVTAPISTYALNSHRLTQNCPEPNGFCCSIYDPITYTPAMMTKHLLLPYQILPPTSDLPKPFNAATGQFEEQDLPYISTISQTVHQRPNDDTHLTPNFFETLLQNDCLPSDKTCNDCLRKKEGSNCKTCATACPCYCNALCRIPVEEKFVSKSLVVSPPLYAKEPHRLIPRIVHQTYFEAVTPEKYPNMSRLMESFKQSGWEYKFYTDEMSLNFLSTHFPSEVREAYETLRPGAFKADLFRYCVLLIYGGVYADMDIMLEANLDLAVGPDIGFMVPQDEPGRPVNRRMCLWNGFIAAAPGHPFLAKTIQTVVNNIRNRFTSVDTDNLFCPHPELSMLHAFDTLFTAGPCILGAMVNKVLGRQGQQSFEAGEIDLWDRGKQDALAKGTEFVVGVDDKPIKRIPGRTIILHQDKLDMGSHRFTFLEKNLVVAATDLPDADDRANQEQPKEHYSKTHVKAGIYGLDRLYTDNVRANEELRIYVDAQWSRYVQRGIRVDPGGGSTTTTATR